MKKSLIVFVLCLMSVAAYGQMIKRTDAIWARTTSNPITLDGKLTEADWAKAESIQVVYGVPGAMPGSGYSFVKGNTWDSTRVTIKYLVWGDSLYMAAIVPDSSIGGDDWEKFDSFLMSLRKHELPDRPSPSFEYFYGWIGAWDATTKGVGADPGFFGHAGGKRTDSTGGVPNWRIWDAKTFVDGVSNSDTGATKATKAADTKWTTEYKFNLKARGYNVSNDIVEMTITIFDADWYWLGDTNYTASSGTWTWHQGRWGGDPFYNILRIHVNSSVTTTSAPQAIDADVVIQNGANHAKPVVDGKLDENVWKNAKPLQLTFGDEALRATYPGIGPYRSGDVKLVADTGASLPTPLDPAKATAKYFFQGDTLYFGITVDDKVLTQRTHLNLKDWARVMIVDRSKSNADHVLQYRDLTVQVVDTGKGYILDGYLPYLKDSLNGAWVGVTKKGTFANFADVDTGYTVELAVDLKKLGYPAGRGDGVVFFGIAVHDGDTVTTPGFRSYGNEVWFFAQGSQSPGAPYKNGAAPAWAYLDPTSFVTSVSNGAGVVPGTFELYGNYPNPFNPSTKIEFAVPVQSNVRLMVYDVIGRVVANEVITAVAQGRHAYTFNAKNLATGVYFYQVQLLDPSNNNVRDIKSSKMLLMK